MVTRPRLSLAAIRIAAPEPAHAAVSGDALT
jgi:hypothetical protein